MNFMSQKLIACLFGVAAVGLVACGDDGGEGGGEGETAAETTASASASDSAEGASDGMEAGTETEATDTEETDTEATDTEETDTEATDTEAEGETGMADGCVDLESEEECGADPACQSVMGQPLKENGPDAPCLEPVEYVGCIPAQGCDDAETWFCVGGNNKPILVSDSCGPDGAEMCEPPVADPPACP